MSCWDSRAAPDPRPAVFERSFPSGAPYLGIARFLAVTGWRDAGDDFVDTLARGHATLWVTIGSASGRAARSYASATVRIV
jgi:hypothetical protein